MADDIDWDEVHDWDGISDLELADEVAARLRGIDARIFEAVRQESRDRQIEVGYWKCRHEQAQQFRPRNTGRAV